jgi:hypothetical protein
MAPAAKSGTATRSDFDRAECDLVESQDVRVGYVVGEMSYILAMTIE